MTTLLPQIEHVYQNHTLDSTRWERFNPRANDIVVATPYKSGTTWMQTIVMYLILQDLQPHSLDDFSSWIDARWNPLEEMLTHLDAQAHRRCLKSHLPLDALLYFPQVKYIVVGRDARDVFMSLWNHYSRHTQEILDILNDTAGRVGDPFPPCPENIRDFWQGWITRGWFDWESEGYPYWSNFHHVQSWWNYRHLPNILLVHYNDLLTDLSGEIRRIANYLEIEVAPEMLVSIAEAVGFESMKSNAEKIIPGAEFSWEGGAKTFINKGTNGRWREVLTEDDLKLYEAAVARELTPDCATWLEHGRLSG
ncbi:MAG: sulfotransferase domain-containing protein [Chloroflexota bacterium]